MLVWPGRFQVRQMFYRNIILLQTALKEECTTDDCNSQEDKEVH